MSRRKQTSDKTFAAYYRAIQFLDSLANLPRDEYMVNLRRKKRSAHVYLRRMQKLLDAWGNPEKKLKIIHVAGTSGKGSTVTYLHHILHRAGYRVGSFYSPYVTVPIEKILVNDRYIAPTELAALTEAIQPILLKHLFTKNAGGASSYFEIWFAIALKYFVQKKCDYAVIETGCGGTFDASNVVTHPVITVITSIGMDHKELLGPSLRDIAYAKAGIIKKYTPIVIGDLKPIPQHVVLQAARRMKAPLIRAPIKDIQITEKTREKHTPGGQRLTLKDGTRLTIPFPGRGQRSNALLALYAARTLNIPDDAIMRGIARSTFPIRQEIVSHKPLIFLDGAHNADKIKDLVQILRELTYRQLHLIIAVKGSKDAGAMMKSIAPLAHRIYLTRFLGTGSKSSPLPLLKRYAKKFAPVGTSIESFLDPFDAVNAARKGARKNDLILATGSIYMVGEIRKLWYPEEYILKNRKSF